MSNRRRQKKPTTGMKPASEVNQEETDTRQPSLLTNRRIIIRIVVIAGVVIGARYFLTPSKEVFVSATEHVHHRGTEIPCSKDYEKERHKFKECTPKKCGRIVMDDVVTRKEAEHLLRIAQNGLALGGGSGGASILDLHSGALSKGTKFINIYSIPDSAQVFTKQDFQIYRNVRRKVQSAISGQFNVPQHSIHLTEPTFFSRMTTKAAETVHDEYWHAHVDKETYGTFDYTSLLYLSDYGTNFQGGRFIFTDNVTNQVIEPKMGRLSFFTSGSENVHYVEKVTDGTRYAMTISFTCDPSKAIADPKLQSTHSTQ